MNTLEQENQWTSLKTSQDLDRLKAKLNIATETHFPGNVLPQTSSEVDFEKLRMSINLQIQEILVQFNSVKNHDDFDVFFCYSSAFSSEFHGIFSDIMIDSDGSLCFDALCPSSSAASVDSLKHQECSKNVQDEAEASWYWGTFVFSSSIFGSIGALLAPPQRILTNEKKKKHPDEAALMLQCMFRSYKAQKELVAKREYAMVPAFDPLGFLVEMNEPPLAIFKVNHFFNVSHV
jgi:hypothetical protein